MTATRSAFPGPLVPVGHVEPVPRRIRARLGGRWVLDTIDALYRWEHPRYPQFHIPEADIDPEALVDDGGDRVGLRTGGVEHRGAGRRHPELPGTIRFAWSALDAWFEEDEEVFVHPRSPYVRVDALRSSRTVRVELDGLVLAQSSSPVLVFETGLPTRWYVDRTALDLAHLRPSATQTACPYKGRTSAWWSVETPAGTYPDLAWSYGFPTSALAPIAGLVAFFDEKVDVVVDGVRQERPVTHFS